MSYAPYQLLTCLSSYASTDPLVSVKLVKPPWITLPATNTTDSHVPACVLPIMVSDVNTVSSKHIIAAHVPVCATTLVTRSEPIPNGYGIRELTAIGTPYKEAGPTTEPALSVTTVSVPA